MKDEKFVKLSAIEQMAEPMEKIHEGEEYGESDHSECRCPCCGKMCEHCADSDEEESEEYEDED